MTHEAQRTAIVLGGGGTTGIAWEEGVLAGLAAGGAPLDVDAVFGTSAGAFVGVALASGADLAARYESQLRGGGAEVAVSPPLSLMARMGLAYLSAAGQPARIGRRMAALTAGLPTVYEPAQRRAIIASRLATREWPASLHVAVTDADSGELVVIDHSSGVELFDAVGASGAVPGMSPVVSFGGRRWIDGGLASAANPLLAAAFTRVLVVAPMPGGLFGMPSAADDVARLNRTGRAILLAPDEPARHQMGRNPYDATRRAGSARAGHRQGLAMAEVVGRLFA